MLNVLVKEPFHRNNNYPYSWTIEDVTTQDDGTLVFHIEDQEEPWIATRKSFQPIFFVKEDLSLWAEVTGRINVFNEQNGFTNKRGFKVDREIMPVKIVDDEFRVSLFDGALTYRQKAKSVSCRTQKDARVIANAACQILADSAPPQNLKPSVELDSTHPRAIVRSHETVAEPVNNHEGVSTYPQPMKVKKAV